MRLPDHRVHIVHHHDVVLVPGTEAFLTRLFVCLGIEIDVKLLDPVRRLCEIASKRHPLGYGNVQASPQRCRELDAERQPIVLAKLRIGIPNFEAQRTVRKYGSVTLLVFPPPQHIVGGHIGASLYFSNSGATWRVTADNTFQTELLLAAASPPGSVRAQAVSRNVRLEISFLNSLSSGMSWSSGNQLEDLPGPPSRA